MLSLQVNSERDTRKPKRVYQEVVREEGGAQEGRTYLATRVLHLGKVNEWKVFIASAHKCSSFSP